MSAGRGRFRAVRWPLVLFAMALLAAGLMISTTERFWSSVDQRYDRERRSLRASETRYRTVDDEKEIIAVYLPRYQVLDRAGVIGDERRLQWVETLRAAANELRLPALRYSIGGREPLDLPFARPGGSYVAHASEMTLDIGLLHEGDLLRLFDALDAKVEGLFDVQQCRLDLRARVPADDEAIADFDVDEELIGARCTLRWLTLTAPAVEGGI